MSVGYDCCARPDWEDCDVTGRCFCRSCGKTEHAAESELRAEPPREQVEKLAALLREHLDEDALPPAYEYELAGWLLGNGVSVGAALPAEHAPPTSFDTAIRDVEDCMRYVVPRDSDKANFEQLRKAVARLRGSRPALAGSPEPLEVLPQDDPTTVDVIAGLAVACGEARVREEYRLAAGGERRYTPLPEETKLFDMLDKVHLSGVRGARGAAPEMPTS